MRSAVKELDCQDAVKGWNEDEIKYLDMEAALALSIRPEKAARLCCRMK